MSGFIRWDVTGLQEWINDVQGIGSPPSFETIGALQAVLEDVYANSQMLVHSPANPGSPFYVPTGSLQKSGYVDSMFTGDDWSGTIGYGGPAPGAVHDPVEYAVYEQERGGEHDFLRDAPDYAPLFLEAVARHFAGGH